MILFPPAKINLGLNVLRKRDDGYHEIETCMFAIPLYDVLEILPSAQFEFKQTGLTVDGNPEDNLCVKAFRLMKESFEIPNVYMHLRKEIPMGAGMGGGSADAAFALRGLNELFDVKATNDDLRELASQLGSDCPFFIEDQPQLGTGRGELLKPISVDLSGYFLKIVNPGIHIGTKEAYAGVHFSTDTISIEEVLRKPIESWKDHLHNDFEPSIFENHPTIASIKKELYAEGALYASMTGSGSTLFGIYANRPQVHFSRYFERILEL